MLLKIEEIRNIIEDINRPGSGPKGISSAYKEILFFLNKNLADSKDKEDVFDVSIDAINRIGYEVGFVAIFREDRKYSSAVRIRVDSELVNRVEDFARKMMPDMTVMRYRIPIFEEGRIFGKFLLEGTKPLVTDNIKVEKKDEVISTNISQLYDNLIPKDSPLVILLPAFKRIVPYKYAISTHIFIEKTPFGNIGIASARELGEEQVNMMLMISEMMAQSLEKIGFGRNYI